MAMDPKQERALRDGTASEEDLPRRIDEESVREQEENPPVDERPRGGRRTAAVADVRPETDPAGRAGDAERGERSTGQGDQASIGAQRGDQSSTDSEEPAPGPPREARRVMKARREHSKGDGNFPAPEPSAQRLGDELPEDREPRDVPKSRDDRSAPKGNTTAGQDERNPNLQTGSDQRPGPPSRAFSLDAARDDAAMPDSAPRPRPIADVKRAGATNGQVTEAPGRPEKAERPKAERTGAARAAPKRSAVKRAAPRTPTAARRLAGRAKKKR